MENNISQIMERIRQNQIRSEQAMKNIYTYLDTIDLFEHIQKFKYKKLYKFMNYLENKFSYKDEYSSSLFDWIGEEEFAEYLNKRGIKIKEVTDTYYNITIQ